MSTLVTTQGIILHTTPYAEHSVVARIFTRQLGAQSCMVSGVRGGKGRTRQNQLQPLSHIEVTLYRSPRSEMHRLKELTWVHPASAPSDMALTAVRLFKAEVLHKSIRNEEPQPDLFDYVATDGDGRYPIAHQPIIFLLRLSCYLGIEPMDNYDSHNVFFNPIEGCYTTSAAMTDPQHPPMLVETARMLHDYLQALHNSAPLPDGNAQQRNMLLQQLLDYYRIHLEGFCNIRSHEILHDVLN